MQYGICHLSIVPVRFTTDDSAEMISQILYGEHYKVLEQRKQWSKIWLALDGCEGWGSNNQMTSIEKDSYSELEKSQSPKHSSELISSVVCRSNRLTPIVIGSTLPDYNILDYKFEGNLVNGKVRKEKSCKNRIILSERSISLGRKNSFWYRCFWACSNGI